MHEEPDIYIDTEMAVEAGGPLRVNQKARFSPKFRDRCRRFGVNRQDLHEAIDHLFADELEQKP